MTHRPDQPYPGQLNPGYQPSYPSTSPQPPYLQNFQLPQYNPQPPYGQPAQYNNRVTYERPPPPPPPQQYGGYQQQPPYGQPAQSYQRPPYPPNPGPAYVRIAECKILFRYTVRSVMLTLPATIGTTRPIPPATTGWLPRSGRSTIWGSATARGVSRSRWPAIWRRPSAAGWWLQAVASSLRPGEPSAEHVPAKRPAP